MTKVARTPTLVLLFLFELSGCSAGVSPNQVCGTYVASYPFGTEIISLNQNGSFTQIITVKNDPPVTTRGKWSFDPHTSSVTFDGLKIVDDGTGHPVSNWRTGTAMLVTKDVEMRWFKVVMETAASYPYIRR